MTRTLRSIITLPFAILVACLGAVTGYLGYYYGFESTTNLSSQLAHQIKSRVVSEFDKLLKEPHKILKFNADRISSGAVSKEDQAGLQKLFLIEVQASHSITSLFFGNTEGGLACGGKEPSDGSNYVIETNGFVAGTFDKVAIDPKSGLKGKLISSFPNYDARTRFWYKNAINIDGPAWSEIYTLFTRHELAISPSMPVRDKAGNLLGVVGGDLFLTHLSQILKEIVGEESWNVFVLDRDGYLVASSAGELPFLIKDGKEAKRMLGTQSSVPLERYVSEDMAGHRFSERDQNDPYHITHNGISYMFQHLRYADGYGIDWEVCILVPEKALLGKVGDFKMVAAALVGLAIIASMAIGYALSKRFTEPIACLRDVAGDLANGKWDATLPEGRSREVQELTKSFSRMRDQLKESKERDQVLIAQINEAKERLNLAAEAANLALWDFNPQTGKAYFSDRWMTMLGYAPDEMDHSYETWRSLLHEDDLESSERTVRGHLESGLPMSMEFRMRAKNGSYLNIRGSGMVVERGEDGRPIRMAGIHQDITATRLLEEKLRQTQKMEAIGTLAGGIAHDFNNLLAAIMGYTELSLMRLPAGSEVRENLQDVLAASERAKSLVNQILSFGRRNERKVVQVDPGRIVEEAMKLLVSVIPKTIDIEMELDRKTGNVLADPTELHQVVMNLCANAYQAMAESGGILRVRLTNTTVEAIEASSVPGLLRGEYVRLEVIDNGPGMNEYTLKRIFDPYFTTKLGGKGTGLGLALVHSIVSSIGGTILVKSAPDVGTAFTIYLPIKEPEQPVYSESREIAEILGEGSILFVDDEPALARLGAKMLESLGYNVRIMTDPLEALRLFESDPMGFDVIVTDQTMPGLTGANLVRRAKAVRNGIPAVMCSGYSDLIDEAGAREMGIAAFVQKPYERNRLGVAVATALGKGT